MDQDHVETDGRRRSAWQRPATRRALLAGAATIAAAGTATVVVGLGRGNGPGEATPSAGEPDQDAQADQGGEAGAVTDVLDEPISDSRRRAGHLLRRAGFGGTLAEIERFAALSPDEAIDRLVDFEGIDNSALDARLAAAGIDLNGYGAGLVVDMQRWWLTRMAFSARPLEERMTYIWHGLLTSQLSKIGNQRAKLMVAQNELFRAHALPRYDDLLQAVSKDPAMLIYLDTVESTKEHPNENYARELMELFSMGVGNYTEEDVREAARAFTGWRVTPPPRIPLPPDATQSERNRAQQEAIQAWQPAFVLQPRAHDSGSKTFLGRTGPFGGEEIVSIVMEQPATGRYITRRLFVELANYNPDPGTLDSLVGTWEASGHDVREVVRAIFKSDDFNAERSYRAFVKSPVEFVVGMIRGLELDVDLRATLQARRLPGRQEGAGAYRAMDQVLFEPHSVAGWPGGANWLSSGTFFARANFLDQLLFPGGRPLPIPALAGLGSPADLVQGALDRLVDGEMTAASRESIVTLVQTIRDPGERAATAAYLVLASPEYQLA